MTTTTLSPRVITSSGWNSSGFFRGSRMSSITEDAPSQVPNAGQMPDFLSLFDIQENIEAFEPSSIGSVTGSFAFLQLMASPTTSVSLDVEMLHLFHSVQVGDEKTFSFVADQVDWTTRSSDDLWVGIRFALRLGAHEMARELARLGAERFPEYTNLQKAGQILAPPKTLPIDDIAKAKRASQNAVANMKWLKEHGESYRGQWVALRDGILLGSAATSKDLFDQLENPKDKTILVTMVY